MSTPNSAEELAAANRRSGTEKHHSIPIQCHAHPLGDYVCSRTVSNLLFAALPPPLPRPDHDPFRLSPFVISRHMKKKTKQDIIAHSLASQLQACNSPVDILTIFQDQALQFERSRSSDERLRRRLSPTINMLYAFSVTLADGVGLVFSPVKVIFVGAGVLLLASAIAAKGLDARQDLLTDVFDRVENFFEDVHLHSCPTYSGDGRNDEIMVEALDILGTATKELKTKKFSKEVTGTTKLEDGLRRPGKMTNDEAQMVIAQMRRVALNIDEKVDGVDKNIQGTSIRVRVVDEKVRDVKAQVQDVGENVIVAKDKDIGDGKDTK
ncbi:hypothetical protein EI94DRAFT_1829277 [Lactarius quietus]|nr:hypothetical protein EI94DRAFT_1829277 [Lactarius quietus]